MLDKEEHEQELMAKSDVVNEEASDSTRSISKNFICIFFNPWL